MLSLLISLLVSGGAWFGLYQWIPEHPVWMVLLTVLAFLLVNMAINLLLRPRLQAIFTAVQKMMEEEQTVLRRKASMMAGRGGAGAMQKLEQEQAAAIRRGIAMLDETRKFEKWSLFVRKQTDTCRAQFYFQLREYDQAEKCLKNSLMLDPMLCAMRMAICYRREKFDEVARLFQKGIRRFRGERGVLLYALYSWCLVQQKKVDEAVQVLVAAKTKVDNPVLKKNWECLVNGQTRRFSNAELGDLWYALGLEQPRMQRVQQPAYGYRR